MFPMVTIAVMVHTIRRVCRVLSPIKDGKYTIVPGLNIDNEYSQKLLKITSDELLTERAAVEHLLK